MKEDGSPSWVAPIQKLFSLTHFHPKPAYLTEASLSSMLRDNHLFPYGMRNAYCLKKVVPTPKNDYT